MPHWGGVNGQQAQLRWFFWRGCSWTPQDGGFLAGRAVTHTTTPCWLDDVIGMFRKLNMAQNCLWLLRANRGLQEMLSVAASGMSALSLGPQPHHCLGGGVLSTTSEMFNGNTAQSVPWLQLCDPKQHSQLDTANLLSHKKGNNVVFGCWVCGDFSGQQDNGYN